MDPITDADGHLRPDLDFRDVPAGLMAKYLGVTVSTVWRRTLEGFYPPAGIRRMGTTTYYRPRIICGCTAQGAA